MVFAGGIEAFQQFDNQYNLGYSVSQYDLANGASSNTLQQNQALNLGLERLFDIGIWMNIEANMVTATNSLGNMANGTGQGNNSMLASQVPNLGGINAKAGYAFVLVRDYLQIIPYALIGWNSNLSMAAMVANNYSNVANDAFITSGFGGRFEYRLNKWVEIYLDQSGAYNWDQSGPLNGIQPQNMITYTTTLGAKFDLYKNLLLGVNGFYSNYQYMAAAPSASVTLNGGSNANGTYYTIYQPQSSIGAMITLGLTY